MAIRVDYVSDNGQYNTKAIAKLSFVFFDAERFVFSHERDTKAQAELIEKARISAPAGSGAAPKL